MKKVVPGDKLGVEEEFFPSDGTYTEQGHILSSNSGLLDHSNHDISVKNKIKKPLGELLKKGENIEVYGEVLAIMDQISFVKIKPIKDDVVLPNYDAILKISDIESGYVKDMHDKIRVGDILKAKILRIDAGRIFISLYGKYGIIDAFCSKCRSKLIKIGFQDGSDVMGCPYCMHKETRKLAR